MRTIRDDLSQAEITKILQALESDQFENIEQTDMAITFRKGYRTFQLISTDLTAEDMGIRVDFDKDALLANESSKESAQWQNLNKFQEKARELVKNKESLNSYQEKSRHSISFNNNQKKFIDDDLAISAIPGWHLVESFNLAVDDKWEAAIHTLVVYHVQIGGRDHVIIADKVYEGTPDKYLAMGHFNVLEFFQSTHLAKVLNELNQVPS